MTGETVSQYESLGAVRIVALKLSDARVSLLVLCEVALLGEAGGADRTDVVFDA